MIGTDTMFMRRRFKHQEFFGMHDRMQLVDICFVRHKAGVDVIDQ